MHVNFLIFGKNDGRYETIDRKNRIHLVFFVGRRVEPLIEPTDGRSVQSKSSVADAEHQKNSRNYRVFAIIRTVNFHGCFMVTKKSAKVEQPTSMSAVVSPIQSAPTNYVIDFFNEDVRLLVEAFPDGIRARTFALFQRMEIVGSYLPNELTKAMGDGLFELRARAKEGIGRTFYCTQIGKKIVVLHAFVKKTQKTPQKELEIARSRMKELKNESN